MLDIKTVFGTIKLVVLPLARRYPYINAFVLLADFVARQLNKDALPEGTDVWDWLGDPKRWDGSIDDRELLIVFQILANGTEAIRNLNFNLRGDDDVWHDALVDRIIQILQLRLVQLKCNTAANQTHMRRIVDMLAILYTYRSRNGHGFAERSTKFQQQTISTLSVIELYRHTRANSVNVIAMDALKMILVRGGANIAENPDLTPSEESNIALQLHSVMKTVAYFPIAADQSLALADDPNDSVSVHLFMDSHIPNHFPEKAYFTQDILDGIERDVSTATERLTTNGTINTVLSTA